MKFTLITDPSREEEIIATVHRESELTSEIERLVMQYNGDGKIAVYDDDGMALMELEDIECISVMDKKSMVVDKDGRHHRIKLRLYEVEKLLPSYFIRINKSAFANEKRIERFAATFSGAVDAVFMSGYKDYVSRRCFAQIRRRYKK